MSALDLILSRLSRVRRVGEGRWVAKCPSHDDRAPSLSIREGGSLVLLHCFAGCNFAKITEALGFRVGDLFNEARHTAATTPQRHHTSDEIEAAFQAHLRRILSEERQRLGYEPPVTSRQHNLACASVNRLLGVQRTPIRSAWWETWPHSEDPLWPALCEHALSTIKAMREHDEPTHEDYLDAQERAAFLLRAEARRTLEAEQTREDAA